MKTEIITPHHLNDFAPSVSAQHFIPGLWAMGAAEVREKRSMRHKLQKHPRLALYFLHSVCTTALRCQGLVMVGGPAQD